ncbi:MAG: type III pantothenate kinase [Polyangiales bacterium]
MVPPLNDVIMSAVDRAFDHDIMVVGPGIKTGISILYENPREVGADRIVNAVAAYDRVQNAGIVVDFGTATTLIAYRRKANTSVAPSRRECKSAPMRFFHARLNFRVPRLCGQRVRLGVTP